MYFLKHISFTYFFAQRVRIFFFVTLLTRPNTHEHIIIYYVSFLLWRTIVMCNTHSCIPFSSTSKNVTSCSWNNFANLLLLLKAPFFVCCFYKRKTCIWNYHYATTRVSYITGIVFTFIVHRSRNKIKLKPLFIGCFCCQCHTWWSVLRWKLLL